MLFLFDRLLLVLAFFYNAGLTYFRFLGGFLLGIVAGIGLAVAVSWSSVLRRMMILPAHLARMLPLLALVPLFNLWLGNTETASYIAGGEWMLSELAVEESNRTLQRTDQLRKLQRSNSSAVPAERRR